MEVVYFSGIQLLPARRCDILKAYRNLTNFFVKKIISIATIFFQIILTFIALFIIYIIFALLDMTDYDFPNAVGFLIFQPIFGLLLCAATIASCMFIGLPIRLIQRLYYWWSKKPYIIFFGVTVGFILLIISLIFTEATNIMIDGENKSKQIPNIKLALAGWFLIAFCLLHFYPLTIINWFKTKLFSRRFDMNEKSLV